jgi:hypothetical protein
MYVNAKMILVESIPGMVREDKGERERGRIQV